MTDSELPPLPPIPRYDSPGDPVPANGGPGASTSIPMLFQPTHGPRDPWAGAVHMFDDLRAGIRRLPAERQIAAWGRLLQRLEEARAEILGPPPTDRTRSPAGHAP